MLKPVATLDPQNSPDAFRNELTTWFQKHGRDYPWRQTDDPYAILVSEVMLQQTQIATVLGRGYYERFLHRFPDPATLAEADDDTLLKAWEGLGYYRRARMLRETARAVVAKGGFSSDLHDLEALPGIGRYTANAVRAFAYNLPAAVVDGNVARVLSRLLDYRDAVDSPRGLKFLWSVATPLADPKHSRIYNSAIMELGQTLCRPGVPDCLNCPVSRFCATRDPETLPLKTQKPRIEEVESHVIWQRDGQGNVLLYQEQGKRRQGLWKLPERSAKEVAHRLIILTRRYTITRYRVTLQIHQERPQTPSRSGESWIPESQLNDLAMPSPYRRALEELLKDSSNE